jgi:hypothetical protein
MVACVDALLTMIRAAMPEMYAAFETVHKHKALAAIYSHISDSNFSHQVLAVRPGDLMVMKVGNVSWSDLGEPNRVSSALARIGVESELAMSAS